jgi:exopolysaccharide production negative regulator
MRISSAARPVILFAALGLAGQAFAFDPTNPSPDASPAEAFRYGFDAYRQGDKVTAIEALGFAAEKGHPIAQWKLGRMYAEGDGTTRDDYKAFEYFSEIADAHADDNPSEPEARFVSNAFVALGNYYKNGIPDNVEPDPNRARQMFNYAASYFGDADAQLNLARMYYDGEGGDRDPLQAARWAKLAADKGNIGAQALLGHLLFEGDGVKREPVVGLMFLTVARERAQPNQRWIFDMQEEALSLATENERRTAIALADDWIEKNDSPQGSPH